MGVISLVVLDHIRGGTQRLAVVLILGSRHPGDVVGSINVNRQWQTKDVAVVVERAVLIGAACGTQ